MKSLRTGGAVLRALVQMVFMGCQYDPYYNQYTKTKPHPDAIVGRWSLDADSRAMVRAKGYKISKVSEPSLEFHADGTFVARNIPDCWNADNREVRGESESGSGAWTIGPNQDYWVLRPHFTEINGEKRGRGVLLHLSGQAPPYKILATVGDPDEGRALVFEKMLSAEKQSGSYEN